jgi:hypothetical protein
MIGLLGGSLMAALAIIQMKRSGKIDQHTIAHARLIHSTFSAGSTANKVSLVIQIVIYILLAILSVLGFVNMSFLYIIVPLTRFTV